jgi:inner membrane protein
MGEAFAGQTVGRKAILWGILAQSVPDIDFVSSLWLDTASHLLAHRGFTHSILFALILSPLMAFVAERWHRPHNISYTRWLSFFAAAILMHIFFDAFNNYGVGWFEPFTHTRISFNSIYVADPFFSIAPGVAFVMLLLLKKKSKMRRFWWRTGLVVSVLYLGYATINKYYVEVKAQEFFGAKHISYKRLLITPAPLQTWLWFVVAGDDKGYYSTYLSVFDKKKDISPLKYSPRNDSLTALVENKNELGKLIRFSQKFYTLEKHADTILFNDLRFGQVIGWQDPRERFAFYYYLQPPMDNTLAVQRGRFAKWDKHSFSSLLKRIKGN